MNDGSPVAEQPDPHQLTPMWRKALDNPWVMLVMLFFVSGALGIPVLWMSRGFSTLSKIVLSIVVLAYSGAMVWFVGWFAWHFLIKPLMDLWYA